MKRLEEIKQELIDLALPIGWIIALADPKMTIICVNDIFVKMLEFDNMDELLATYNNSAWAFVSPLDTERLKNYASTRIGTSDEYEISYRALKKGGGYVWLNQNSRHTIDDSGREVVFAYYTDITSQKQMEEEISAGVQKYETLVNSVPGGVGMYALNDTFTPIFMSERAYELCNMTKAEYQLATKNSTLDVFHPNDRQGFLDEVAAARKENRKFEYSHRVLQKDGSYRWMRVSGQVITGPEDTPVLYTVFTDVHEQIKAEQALRESESRYSAAIKSANINIWEYDYANDVMTIFSKSPKVHPEDNVVANYSKLVVDEGHISDESAPLLFDMIKRLKNGEKEVTADLWIRQNREDDFWCERVIYTNAFDEEGNPVRAYCIGHDITREKEAEKRYRDELSYREAMQKATMASINVNLTKNIIMDYKSVFPEITKHMDAAKTAQEYFDYVYTELETKKMQKECAAAFNCAALRRQFANGKTTLSMELTRLIAGRRYWTIMTTHMMKKAETNDIIAFVYSTNITNEKTMQNVMNAIVKTDYDFLVVVDAARDSAIRYSEKDIGNNYAHESENFEEETQKYIYKYVCKQDASRVAEEVKLKNILSNLDSKGTHSVFYSVPNPKGGTLKKQLRFCYINQELKSFLMTRIDISAAVTEQEKKNQELTEAARMAEHANAAKSEFLSRISHEIRTPMNAIMGMDQLAMQHLDDKKFIIECIEKSQYASKYLLQLLNDILDMSKIETGKITLKNEAFHCQPLLDAIDSIVDTQAAEKGVHYVLTQFEGCHSSYIGDGIRLQQILINILTNAVKFTPKGGTVRLDITQISADEEKENICFKISDTGIGIGEKFLPNIFKPFSQEHNGSTSGYGGSGLGLAISKNLAELMGGNISVESKSGEGTTFYVKIPLGISRQDSKKATISDVPNTNETYDLSGKKILLVEDHQLNIMVAKKLLEFKNALVDVAENGKDGLEMFSISPEHTYDAVLMDIRMPIMDGLQSAREIRGLNNEWAKKVPIIAMSANAFDDDVEKSEKAGMNAHLAKPIDADILYQTLYELIFKKTNGKSGDKPDVLPS